MSKIFIELFYLSKLVPSWKKNGQTWGRECLTVPTTLIESLKQISLPKKDITKLAHSDNKFAAFQPYIVILCSLNISLKTKKKYQNLTLKPFLSYWSTNFEISFILYFKFTCAITILYIMYVTFLNRTWTFLVGSV